MYAIVKEGGRQYNVKEGDLFYVDKRLGSEKGNDIEIKDVLMIKTDDTSEPIIGKPFVEGASVCCKVIEERRMKKVIIFKYKRRKNYRKKQGHRQNMTALKVLNIKYNGR